MSISAGCVSLIRKLANIFELTDPERSAIASLRMQEVELAANEDVVRQGDKPTKSFYIRSGFTCVYKTTSSGRRQITALQIAGDAPDLQSLHLPVMDISIAALTRCSVAYVRHDDLRALYKEHPRLVGALWRETLIDASIYREWLTGLGQRPAYERIAHLICEMIIRHKVVGLAPEEGEGISIQWPIKQVQLGDTLGLSSVHVNRSIQALRENRLIA